MLKIAENGYAEKAVMITGAARSGTTIVGKLIHSFEGVEYEFEPPTLISLFVQIEQIHKEHWKLLYETYLCKHILENSILGRNINCSTKDDSSIYLVKSREEIQDRLSGLYSPEHPVIAYKIPSMAGYIPRLLEYYPQTRVVLVQRNQDEVINSLLKKKWFSSNNVLWPCHKDTHAPFWVDDQAAWASMSEIDRCAYYYLKMSGDKETARFCVDYASLLEDPAGTAKLLSDCLGLEFGDKTEEIISSIKPQQK